MKTNVIIEKLDNFGRGIARIDRIPVFIENALPGEQVSIAITKQKKNYMEGVVIEYHQKSMDRIDPICPFYEMCGGCTIMHMEYPHQLLFKQQKIEEIMHKFSLDVPVKPILKTNPYYYRNKVTLQVKEKVGYYQKKSYDIVPIDFCYIADSKINDVIAKLQQVDLSGVEQIMIRSIEHIMIVFKGKHLSKSLISSFSHVDSIYFNDTFVYGKSHLLEKVGKYSYYLSSSSFFQVNTLGMQLLYDKVLEYGNFSKEDKVLDLYCGTGTIGIYVSEYCKEVFGIEINPEAIQDANKNKEINHISNISFACGDVGLKLEEKHFNPTKIIVDPPRSGLDHKAIAQIQKIKPKQLIYVSCNPMTLARDLQILQTDYILQEVTPVDMFPNTDHVECVVILEKTK